MSENQKDIQADPRREFWLQQYATAFTTGDKRAAALALQFAQQYSRPVILVRRKQTQQS